VKITLFKLFLPGYVLRATFLFSVKNIFPSEGKLNRWIWRKTNDPFHQFEIVFFCKPETAAVTGGTMSGVLLTLSDVRVTGFSEFSHIGRLFTLAVFLLSEAQP
jgi:hypothetical protein